MQHSNLIEGFIFATNLYISNFCDICFVVVCTNNCSGYTELQSKAYFWWIWIDSKSSRNIRYQTLLYWILIRILWKTMEKYTNIQKFYLYDRKNSFLKMNYTFSSDPIGIHALRYDYDISLVWINANMIIRFWHNKERKSNRGYFCFILRRWGNVNRHVEAVFMRLVN